MPLTKSSSKAALGQNIAAERRAGRPLDQAIAIAEETRRTAAKKAGKSLRGMMPPKKG